MILNKYFLENPSSASLSRYPPNDTANRLLVTTLPVTAHHGLCFLHSQFGGLERSHCFVVGSSTGAGSLLLNVIPFQLYGIRITALRIDGN